MAETIRQKLAAELRRYLDKDFLKASMAVCALVASADQKVMLSERYQIDRAITKEPSLAHFDAAKATELLDSYLHELEVEEEKARRVLTNKVARLRGDPKRARTLMRVAYLIITADDEIALEERVVFVNLCTTLGLDPAVVWKELHGDGEGPAG